MSEKNQETYKAEIANEYQALRDKQAQKADLLSLEDAKKMKPNLF
jgi:5-methyltetrahydrofolate--homocysteine methyltransferase